jgi:hypothetical protein
VVIGTRTVEINEHVFELIRLAAALDRVDVAMYLESRGMHAIESTPASLASARADAAVQSGRKRTSGFASCRSGAARMGARNAGEPRLGRILPRREIVVEGHESKSCIRRRPGPIYEHTARSPALSDACDLCGRPLGVKTIEVLRGEERHTFECMSCDHEQVRTVLVASA